MMSYPEGFEKLLSGCLFIITYYLSGPRPYFFAPILLALA